MTNLPYLEKHPGGKIITLTKEEFRDLHIKSEVNKFLTDNYFDPNIKIYLRDLLIDLNINYSIKNLSDKNICEVSFENSGDFIYLNRDYTYENKCAIIYNAFAMFIEYRKEKGLSYNIIDYVEGDFNLSFNKEAILKEKNSQSFVNKIAEEFKNRDLCYTKYKETMFK